ncbi:hypothetical protein [Pedobacter agri]|uniref:hypothetical protein n=1 Tax=Pedobacter agri TaxID=454586 RepID=UPI00292EE11C|nr:hypothetical protein [Pedobacter agri]
MNGLVLLAYAALPNIVGDYNLLKTSVILRNEESASYETDSSFLIMTAYSGLLQQKVFSLLSSLGSKETASLEKLMQRYNSVI